MRKAPIAMAFLVLFGLSFALDIEFYYGQGCPHCAVTGETLRAMADEYNLSISAHEIYYNAEERSAFMREYERFGQDINTGGVPTTIVEHGTMVLGGMPEETWGRLFSECMESGCPEGAYTYITLPAALGNGTQNASQQNGTGDGGQVQLMDPVEERNGAGTMALSVLIGAAVVDSVNPCTIAVMVLLLGAIISARGKREALVSGMVFSLVIFIMYMLYGLGIMRAITSFGLTSAFYAVVTAGALLLAIMELNAYFDYKPGFLAVEMPMFLRPYAKRAAAGATSPLGVAAAAMLCSLFLLPCSSGPYLVVLGMLARAATLQTVGYLVLYNFFFVLPMVIITVAIYLGKTTVEEVNLAKEKYIRQIHLVSGLILLALFFLLLAQILGYI